MWIRTTRITLLVALLLAIAVLAYLAAHPHLYAGHLGRVITRNLLRDTGVSGLDPVTPPVSDCLPLDPVDDLYIPDFVAGSVDPDSTNPSPLVFYAIDAPVWIWLSVAPTGEIRIDF